MRGGAEYGEEIAARLDPDRMDDSFKDFWQDLRRALRSTYGDPKA